MDTKTEANAKVSFINRIKKFLDDLYVGEETYEKVSGKFTNAIKVFIVSSRKFIVDDCYTKASSIAYTTIVSLVPTLTVGLTFYSIFTGVGDKKEEVFRKISVFLLEHNIKLNIDPVIEAISSLIENAGKIGGIGAIIMVFTATAVLRTLEKSLNDIWKVKKQRTIFLKVIYYWAALTLGPIMLIAGTTVATQVSSFFSSPNYRAAFVDNQNNLWVAGQKASLQLSTRGGMQFRVIGTDKIDFENQYVYEFDTVSKSFKEMEYLIEETEFKKTEFSDIQFLGDTGWAIGRNGIMLITYDRGESWNLLKYGNFNFNDICMLDENRGYLIADNGYFFKTADGGYTWHIVEIDNYSSNLNSIAFNKNVGIITGDKGAIITTTDEGKKWTIEYLNESRIKKKFVNLNRVFFQSDKRIWIVGDEGLVLYSTNGGRSWKNEKYQEKNYFAVYFMDDARGFIGGDKGTLLYTDNAGEKWSRMSLQTGRINQLIAAGGGIFAIGNNGTVLKSVNMGKSWSGVRGGSVAGLFLNFFAPFIFIWLLFLLTYIALPNMKIPFKPAAIGASFTGAVWVVFILLFIVYVKSFANSTVAIYGGLAAIPLFLLMVYTSTLIILYGAEISYTLMHPHTYRQLKKTFADRKDTTIYFGISILYTIYKNFEKGRGASNFKDFMKITANKAEEIDFFIALFKKENLILENLEGGYLPATSSHKIMISDVFDLIHDASLIIPTYAPSDPLKKYCHTMFSQMRESRKDIIGSITLARVIEETS